MRAHALIEATAADTPNAIAVVAGADQLTYSELNARANQLAHFLCENGVGPDVLVGLCLKRTAETLVGILGILKAGGAYVPLDPSYPTERLALMMQDSRIEILVTTSDLAAICPVSGARAVRLDADWPIIGKRRRENLDSVGAASNLAYVIYTSGSTGRPKGVMITHAGLVNYLVWAAEEYGPEARRSALVHSSVSFDLTITGLLTPLLLGGRVELLAEENGVNGLLAALRGDEHYGLIKITPAHLELLSRQLKPNQLAGKVGLFVIGGENLEAEKLRLWREFSPSTRLINEYGPTETVVGCCTYEVRASDPHVGSVPIGRAIANTTLYVLDEELRPVAAGDTGELHIGGAGVARGYLNMPELTEQQFLSDPFSLEPNARMYKTGDLVRCRESVLFEYLGRLDDQVKLRGYRIELGEIESAIAEHFAVRQSAAKLQVDESGHKRLVGYAIRRENHSVSETQLRDFLLRKLPPYMVPATVAFLDDLPLTLNGKVDRHALPFPKTEELRTHRSIIRPRNNVESEITTMFRELLNLQQVSLTDSFLELGGDSLLVMELLVRIEKCFGKQLSMATLFEAPSISQLAEVVQHQWSAPSEVVPIQPAGSLPPFFCVGGGPFFRSLAGHLGTERPFLGLAPTLQMLGTQPQILEDIAAASLEILRQYQREGPYLLGGWSAFGVVAYEIAQQLLARGYEVSLLALFDTRNPALSKQALNQKWRDAHRQKLRFWAKELKGLDLVQLPLYVSEKVTELRRKIRQSNSRVPARTEDAIQAVVASYRPLPYPARVAFFNPSSRPEGATWDFGQGWQNLVTGPFEVHEVPGNHRSMFSDPNVVSLAQKLSKCMCSSG